MPTAVPAALPQLAAAPDLRRGLWVRGHVRDLHPAQLRLFDTMFLFDMSDQEAETLRSAIPLPISRVRRLREEVAEQYPPEAVLVFTAGTDRATGARVPKVAGNPAIMPLCAMGPSIRKARPTLMSRQW